MKTVELTQEQAQVLQNVENGVLYTKKENPHFAELLSNKYIIVEGVGCHRKLRVNRDYKFKRSFTIAREMRVSFTPHHQSSSKELQLGKVTQEIMAPGTNKKFYRIKTDEGKIFTKRSTSCTIIE